MLDLMVIGDVNAVLEGRVAKDALIELPSQTLFFGLGSIAIEKAGLHVGEALIFEGEASVYIPNQKWVQEKNVLTPFLMGISRKPRTSIEVKKTINLSELYNELLVTYPKGFALVGSATFSSLSALYIKRDPIYNENININMEKYWQAESYTQKPAKFFAVVLPYLNKKAFYKNPHDTQSSPIYSHTHGLIDEGTRHFLTQSILTEGALWIEELYPPLVQ